MSSFGRGGLEQVDGNSGLTNKTSFKEVVFICLLYWPLFLGLLILSTASAWLYLQFKVPLYETTATILIKDERKGAEDAKGPEAINLFASKKIVENEVEVLKSKTLAQQVVKNLHLYASITEKGKFIHHSAYTSSPVQIIAQYPDSIKVLKKQPFQYDPATRKVILDGFKYSLNSWAKTPYGTLKFLSNQYYQPPSEARPLFLSLSPVKQAANDILGSLNVSVVNKLSSVIDMSYRDEVPQRGENILNELVNVYNKSAINDKNVLAGNTLAFIEDRLKLVVQELNSIEGQLQRYRTKNNVVDISTQGRVFLENVGINDQKISDISMQLAILNQVEGYVSGKGAQGGIVPSTVGVTDPVLSGLLDKLYNAELEYEKTRKIAPEGNPMLISLSDQINKIKPSILENIQSQRRSLQAGKTDLSITNNKYVSLLQTMPQKERELLEISRQQSIKNSIYTFLLQKREEAALAFASTVSGNRQVDTAQSSDFPVSPKKPIIYLLSVFSAFSLGLAGIFVKKGLNNKVNSHNEVKELTDMPIVGELVYNPTKDLIVVGNSKRSLIAEQFRHMRTSLRYLKVNSNIKKILVTSSISSEGKSFIATNVAASLALTGKRVVLLEMDLRKPDLVEHPVGITDYLMGNKEIQDIIEATEITNNLFVIPAGSIPPNPSELLVNSKLEELLSYLERAFDYIIIDSSPVIPVTDAYIISPLCDVTLFIVRQGVTPRPIIQTLNERFQTKGLKNVAIVFNGIKEKGFSKYYYGYGYSNKYVNSD